MTFRKNWLTLSLVMKFVLKLLVVFALSLLACGNVAEPAAPECPAVVEGFAANAAEITTADDERERYADWNRMEIAEACCQINDSRPQSSGQRVRSNSFRINSFTSSRVAFCRGGKIVCLRYADGFSYFVGLLPSGFLSVSDYLISLRKMRN